MSFAKSGLSSVASVLCGFAVGGTLVTAVLGNLSGTAHAAGEVSSIQTVEVPATPFSFSVDGTTYNWGMGNNQLMTGFTVGASNFSYATSANRVELRRDDIAGVTTGEPCGLFVERLADGTASQSLAADYPSDGSGTGNCDLPALLASRVINRGAVDLFSNRLPDAKNIERLDYLFDSGVLTPYDPSAMQLAGHVIAEKRGNNPIKVAAILALDAFGQPAVYGPLITVNAHGCQDPLLCFGDTNLTHSYTFFQNEFNNPQGFPVATERSVETVSMAMVSADRLGLNPGQRYYGFSFFADDVFSDQHTLTDPASFPNDTADLNITSGDDADLYGGLSGYFVADEINVGTGKVFKDENGDGLPADTEAGISHLTIQLFTDSDGNAVFDPNQDPSLGDSIDTDLGGNFVLPGLPDGSYFVMIDVNDPDLPPGLEIPGGGNPQWLIVSGGDPSPVYFPFIDPNAGGGQTTGTPGGGDGSGGTDAGGTDSGGTDSGSTDSGSSDAGGSDAGSTDSGGTDAGSSDSGSTDAGGSDAGSDAGSTDSGSTDSGSTDSGGTDAGSSDSGSTDAGGSDAGSSDSGSTDAGGSDAGSTDSGSTDAGGSDAGSTDSGSTDAGGSDAGSTDSGTTDAGSSDAGSTDSGTTDSGTTGSGTTDSGSTDSGSTDSGSTDGGMPGTDTPINDPLTVANVDMFDVDQGFTAMPDLLANDIDGAGQGLRIISVSESPNATITEAGGVVSYTPNFGFYGRDTFLYVIEDADGTQATGTAIANVIRFSDINGNGTNDFIECGCSNLTLETGVHGSGIGRLPLSTVLLLLLVSSHRLWSRRRSAQQPVSHSGDVV